jgi:hypothetical protein
LHALLEHMVVSCHVISSFTWSFICHRRSTTVRAGLRAACTAGVVHLPLVCCFAESPAHVRCAVPGSRALQQHSGPGCPMSSRPHGSPCLRRASCRRSSAAQVSTSPKSCALAKQVWWQAVRRRISSSCRQQASHDGVNAESRCKHTSPQAVCHQCRWWCAGRGGPGGAR